MNKHNYILDEEIHLEYVYVLKLLFYKHISQTVGYKSTNQQKSYVNWCEGYLPLLSINKGQAYYSLFSLLTQLLQVLVENVFQITPQEKNQVGFNLGIRLAIGCVQCYSPVVAKVLNRPFCYCSRCQRRGLHLTKKLVACHCWHRVGVQAVAKPRFEASFCSCLLLGCLQ